MKCKMCGAELKRKGDICKNCYDEYVKQEALKSENEQVMFSIKRKYNPKFNVCKSVDLILLEVIIALASFSAYGTGLGILATILCIIVFGAWMFFCKKRAVGTKTVFYETKLKYKAKYMFVDKEEIIPYDDIKDMAYFQTKSQKMFKIGDIRFYTKGFLSGLTISDIPNIEESFEKMKDIINGSR